jgi:flagellar capping protein FliD
MEAMRESWTDDRLDDLNGKVDALRVEMSDRFDKIDGRFDKIDDRFEKMDDRFEKMDDRFEKMDDRFDRRFERIDDRFESMDARLLQIYQTMLWFCGVALAALIGLLATQI